MCEGGERRPGSATACYPASFQLFNILSLTFGARPPLFVCTCTEVLQKGWGQRPSRERYFTEKKLIRRENKGMRTASVPGLPFPSGSFASPVARSGFCEERLLSEEL